MAAAYQVHDRKLIVTLPESSNYNNNMQQLLSMFDDADFAKEIILDTHTPDHTLALDVKSLFSLVENTLRTSASIVDSLVNPAAATKAPLLPVLDSTAIPKDSYSAAEIAAKTVIINPPVHAIREVTCQITCKALEAKNLKEMVVELFKQLSGQSWVGKAVVTLAALAIYYYDFWSLAATQTSNKLPLSIAILKGIPAITKIEDFQRIQIFGMINEIIKMSFEMTRCIVEFERESKEVPELSTVIDIAPSVIQIIISILTCSIYFSSVTTSTSLDESIGQALPVFIRRVNMILHVIMRQLEYFRQKKEEYVEYQRVQQIFAATSVNVELIAALISSTNYEAKPLYWGSNHTTVTIECLRKKKVLLLISSVFTLSPSDLSILINIYKEPKFQLNQYEILWVPIIVESENTNVVQQEQLFETLKSQMPWYSINSLNLVSSIGVKIIMEKWHFRPDSPSVVVLDQHGKVECQNAMHMIQMWGFHSFPFTDAAVTSIWGNRDVTWFDLLINDSLINNIQEAIKQEQLIFIYGGGESSEAHQFDEGIHRITAGGISNISTFNVTNVQLFWTRLESCIFSMMQAKIDLFQPIMQDILNIYTNYKKGAGFVLLIKGKQVIINASLTAVLKLIFDYDAWKNQLSGNRFEIVLQDQYFKLVDPSQQPGCHYLFIPNMVGYMPQNIKCPMCPRIMKNIVRFECCHGAH